MLKKTITVLLALFFFVLPWQTRLVYQSASLNGNFWEYGSLTWYGTEMILWLVIVLAFVELIKNPIFRNRLKMRQGNIKNVLLAVVGFAFLFVTLFHGLNPEISFQFVFRLIGAACLVVLLAGSEFSSHYMAAWWLGGVFQGILAMWQFLSQAVTPIKFLGMAPHLPQDLGAFVIEFGDERWLRAYGAFGSPNVLGGFLAIVFLFGLVLYRSLPPGPKRIGIAVGQIMVTAGLVLSFSRAAWLAACIGVVCLTAALYRQKQSVRPPVQPILFSVATIVILFIAFKPLFLVRSQAVGRLEQLSISSRAEQLRDWKKIIKTRTFLGVGPGLYTLALFRMNPALPAWQYQPVHNIFLLSAAEIGVVGFVAFLVLIIFLTRYIWKNSPLYIPFLVVLVLLGIFDHWLWSMYVGQMVWWGVIGFGLSRRKS